jgi:hypothetical protein
VGANSSDVITRTQHPIQPIIVHTIHHFQGLTLDYLTFHSNEIHHHGLTYTTLFHVRKKEILF